jgi:hypothetical protein
MTALLHTDEQILRRRFRLRQSRTAPCGLCTFDTYVGHVDIALATCFRYKLEERRESMQTPTGPWPDIWGVISEAHS